MKTDSHVLRKLNRAQTIDNLRQEQDDIEYESDEDEGAAEYYGEVESCIIACKNFSLTDEAVVDEIQGLCQGKHVVYEKN